MSLLKHDPLLQTTPLSGFDAVGELVAAIQQLALAESLDGIQVVVRTAARRLTGADGATFVLRDGDLCHYVDEDAIAPLWKGQRFPMEACVSGWAMQRREAVVIPDVSRDPRAPRDTYRPTFVKSLCAVPIRTLNPVGAIENYWAVPHEIQHTEVMLLRALADSTAVAMENVRMLRELDDARLETLERLARAAEYRDDATFQHTERVAAITAAIATDVGLDTEAVENLRQAATLHDIGKIAISDTLLLKPGWFTYRPARRSSTAADRKCSEPRARSSFPTTSGGMAKATRSVCQARQFHSAVGSWRWPTCSTR
jgi:GAF domain-containing protein